MKLHTSVVGAVLLVSLAASAVAAPGSVSVTVTVDTTKPGPQIDRNIYGQFATSTAIARMSSTRSRRSMYR